MPAAIIAWRSVRAFDPTEVPIEFATSFAPKFAARYKARKAIAPNCQKSEFQTSNIKTYLRLALMVATVIP